MSRSRRTLKATFQSDFECFGQQGTIVIAQGIVTRVSCSAPDSNMRVSQRFWNGGLCGVAWQSRRRRNDQATKNSAGWKVFARSDRRRCQPLALAHAAHHATQGGVLLSRPWHTQDACEPRVSARTLVCKDSILMRLADTTTEETDLSDSFDQHSKVE